MVLEIGLGFGGLIWVLLVVGVKWVVVVEKDIRCLLVLVDIVVYYLGKFEVIEGDVLKFDLVVIIGGDKVWIVVNFFYNVGI